MKMSEAIRSISYLKAHAAELVRDVAENQKTMVITQNGEARVVVQDIRSYEDTQETLMLLKMLAQSKKSQEQGKGKPLKEAFASVRARAGRRSRP